MPKVMRCMIWKATFENERGQSIERFIPAYSITDATSVAQHQFRGVNEALVGVVATRNEAPAALGVL